MEVPIKIEISAEIPECSIFTFPDDHLSLAASESFIKVQENRLVPCQILTRKSLHRVHRLGNLTSLCPNLCICLESLSSPAILESKSFWLLICDQPGAKTSSQAGIEKCILPSFGCAVFCLFMSGGWVNHLHENLPWISNTSSAQ